MKKKVSLFDLLGLSVVNVQGRFVMYLKSYIKLFGLFWGLTQIAVVHVCSQTRMPTSGIPVLEVPEINANALTARDKALRIRYEKIGQFAEPCEVRADKADYGVWEEVGDGRVIWRLFISAPGAKDINLGITEIFIPEGCRCS